MNLNIMDQSQFFDLNLPAFWLMFSFIETWYFMAIFFRVQCSVYVVKYKQCENNNNNCNIYSFKNSYQFVKGYEFV